MATLDPKTDRLKAAWTKFNAKISGVRAKTKELMGTVEEEKKNKEVDALRSRIKGV